MLYHYAITPEVFEPSAINEMKPNGVVLVELLRGMCENGLLADLHAGRWMTQVRRFQGQAGISREVRDRIQTCLEVLHNSNRLVRHPAGSSVFDNDDFRWLHWSIERHQANPLFAVFSSDIYLELSGLVDDILIPLSGALDAECWTCRQRSVRFKMTESNLRDCLAPLLAYAQKVTLIDPYMTCREERFLNTVQHCAFLLGRHDSTITPGVIHIHAGDPETDGPKRHHESTNERLERWKQALKPVARQWEHSFRISLWKSKPGNSNFHDRYLITDQCGVKAPGGLDFLPDEEEQRARITTWSSLEADQVTAIVHEEFHPQKSPYKRLGSIEVLP